jgi:LDH2 family malate/lactate/ureidoglycolate dehydrogenase
MMALPARCGGNAVSHDIAHDWKLRIRDDEAVRVDSTRLLGFIARCYATLGLEPQAARDAADVLVQADLLGKDTHGVALFPGYVGNVRSGAWNMRPRIAVVKETLNTALVDGDSGPGATVGRYAMEIAIAKARTGAVGVVTVRNSRHFGAAGIYAQRALAHNQIGIAMTNASAQVAPTFGSEPRFGTNPIAVAAPAGRYRYWALDMATSTVPHNRVTLAARLGRAMPPGWVTDRQGAPVTDPATAREGRLLLPLGSSPAASSHKGYGLAVWVDIMCGVLSGHGFGMHLPDGKVGHFFAAIDVTAFIPLAQFRAMMDQMLDDLRATPTLAGEERVLYAGEEEQAIEADRRANGVPLHPATIAELRRIGDEIDVPWTLSS